MKLRLPHLLRRLLTAAMTVTSVTVGTANSSYAADAMSPTTLNAGVNDTENTELQAYKLRMQGGASSSYTLSGEMSDLLEDETGTGETGVEGFESPLGDTGSASAAAFSLGDDAAAANAPLSELLPGEQGENLTTGETPSNVGQGGTTGSLDAPDVASVGADAAEASGTFALTRDASGLTWDGTEASSTWGNGKFGTQNVTADDLAASNVIFTSGDGISTNVTLTSNVTVGGMTISGGGYTFSGAGAGDAGNFLITTGSLSASGGEASTITNISVADSGSIIVDGNGTELTLVKLAPTNPSAPIQFSNGGKLTIGNDDTRYGVFSGSVTVSGTPDAQLHLYTDATTTTGGRVHLLDSSEHLDVYIHGNLELNLAAGAQNDSTWTLTTVRSADLFMDANSTIFVRANEATLTPANNIYMQGNLALNVAEGVTADSTTLTSQISLAPTFSGELEKTGAGSITLSGNLSTTSLKVSAGTLKLTGSSIASDAYSVASGATLQFSGDADMAAATSALLNATGAGNISITGTSKTDTIISLENGAASTATGNLSLSNLTLDAHRSISAIYNLSSYTSMNWDNVYVKYHGVSTTFNNVTVGSNGATVGIQDMDGYNKLMKFAGTTTLNGGLILQSNQWKAQWQIDALTGSGDLSFASSTNSSSDPVELTILSASDYKGDITVTSHVKTATLKLVNDSANAASYGSAESSLTLNGASSLYMKGAGALTLNSKLVVSGNATLANETLGAVVERTLTAVEIAAGNTLTLRNVPSSVTQGQQATPAVVWNFNDLSGGGHLVWESFSSNSKTNQLVLSGDGSDFTGNVTVNRSFDTSQGKYQTFVVLNAENAVKNSLISLNSTTTATNNKANAPVSLAVNVANANVGGLQSDEYAHLFAGAAPADKSDDAASSSAANTLTITGADTYTFAGTVGTDDDTKRLSLSMTGAGSQTFSGVAHVGDVSVSNGTLALRDATSQVYGDITVSGGTLNFGGSYTLGKGQTLSVLTGTENAAQLGGLTLSGGDMVFDIKSLSLAASALSVGTVTVSLSEGTTTQQVTLQNADYLLSGRYVLATGWAGAQGLSFSGNDLVNGTANFSVQNGELVLDYTSSYYYKWVGGSVGVWNTTDANWSHPSADSPTVFDPDKGVVFESDADVTVTEEVSVNKLIVRDDATVSITETETAALTAQSIEVREGATLAFASTKNGFTPATVSGAGTVGLQLSNNYDNAVRLEGFDGVLYVNSGWFDLYTSTAEYVAGSVTADDDSDNVAQLGSKLHVGQGVNMQLTGGKTVVMDADMVLSAGNHEIHHNGSAKLIVNGDVTGEGTWVHKGTSGTLTFSETGSVTLGGFSTGNAGTISFNATTTLGTANLTQGAVTFANTTDIIGRANISGGTVNFNGVTTIGEATISNGTTTFANTATADIDTLTISGGTVNFNGATTIGEATISNGTTTFANTADIDTATITGGTVNFNGATTIGEAMISNGTTTFANSGSVNLGVFQQSGGVTEFKGDVSLDTLKLTGGTVTLHNVDNDTDAVKNIGEIQLSGNGTKLYVFFDDSRLTSIDLASVKVAGTTNLGTYDSDSSYQGLINIANLSNAEAGSTATLTLSSGSKTTLATAINVNGGSFAGTLKLENVAGSGGTRRLAVNLNAQNVASGAVIEFVDKNNDYNYVALGLGATEVHVAGLTGTSTTNVGEIYGYQINSGAAAFNNVNANDTATRTLVLNVTSASPLTTTAKLYNNINLVKTGAGSQTISGASVLGAVTVKEGTLALTNTDSTISGDITVSGGTLDFDGSYTLGAGQVLSVLTGTADAVQLGGLTLNGGTMVFDIGALAPDGTSAALKVLEGNAVVMNTAGTLRLNYDGGIVASGRYKLASGDWSAVGTDHEFTIEGLSYGGGSAKLQVTAGGLFLDYTATEETNFYTWIGGAEGNWNTSDTHWDNTIDTLNDSAAFANSAADAPTHAVFDGGSANVTVGEAIVVDSLSILGGAQVTLGMGAGASFTAGEVILANGKLTLGSEKNWSSINSVTIKEHGILELDYGTGMDNTEDATNILLQGGTINLRNGRGTHTTLRADITLDGSGTIAGSRSGDSTTISGTITGDGTLTFAKELMNNNTNVINVSASITDGAGDPLALYIKDAKVKLTGTNNTYTGGTVIGKDGELTITNAKALSSHNGMTSETALGKLSGEGTLVLDLGSGNSACATGTGTNAVMGGFTGTVDVKSGSFQVGADKSSSVGALADFGASKVIVRDEATFVTHFGYGGNNIGVQGGSYELGTDLDLMSGATVYNDDGNTTYAGNIRFNVKDDGTYNTEGTVKWTHNWHKVLTLAGLLQGDGVVELHHSNEADTIYKITGEHNTFQGEYKVVCNADGKSIKLHLGSETAAQYAGINLANAKSASYLVLDSNATIRELQGVAGSAVQASGVYTLSVSEGDFGGSLQNGTGTLALIKQGDGTLILRGANTYTGGTTINGGTLQLANAATLASNVTVEEGATFELNANTQAMTFGQTISGAGSVKKSGSNDVTFTQDHSYTGTTTIEAGKLILNTQGIYTLDGAVSGAGTLQVNGGTTLQVNNAAYAIDTAVNLQAADALLQIDVDGEYTISKNITGNGGLRIESGTVTLGPDNKYTGGTYIGDEGTLIVTNARGAGGNFTDKRLGHVSGTGTLVIKLADNSNTTRVHGLNGDDTMAGFTGTLDLQKGYFQIGSGVTGGDGANTVFTAGKVIVHNGATFVTQFGAGEAAPKTLDSAMDLMAGANLENLDGYVNLQGNIRFNLADAEAGTFDETGTVNLYQRDGDILTLAGVVSGAGTVQLNRWSTSVNNTNAAEGRYRLTNNQNTFSGEYQLVDSQASPADRTVTLYLAAENAAKDATINMATAAGKGQLVLESNATIHALKGGAGNGNVVKATGDYTLTVSEGDFGGALVDDGDNQLSLIKQGDGTLILRGANTYTGGTTINGGTLQLANAATLSSHVTVNAGGTLDFYAWEQNMLFEQSISGAGKVTITALPQQGSTSSNVVTFNKAHTYTGGTVVNSGTLRLTDGASLSSGVELTNDSLMEFVAEIGDMTFDQTISGVGGVKVDTEHKVTFTKAHTYLGGTVVSKGTLELAGEASLADVSGLWEQAEESGDMGPVHNAMLSIEAGGTLLLNTTEAVTLHQLIMGAYPTSNEEGEMVLTSFIHKTGEAHAVLSGLSYVGRITVAGLDDGANANAGILSIVKANSSVWELLVAHGAVHVGAEGQVKGNDVKVTRLEMGACGAGGTTSQLVVHEDSSLTVAESAHLATNAADTELTVKGALLAKDAQLTMGAAKTTITIDGGTLAAQGMADMNPAQTGAGLDLLLTNNGKLILGAVGLSTEQTTDIQLGKGTVGMTADMTLAEDMTLTSAEGTTFDTSKYIYDRTPYDYDTNEGYRPIVQRVDEAGTMTVTGNISSAAEGEAAKMNVVGAGTLQLNGNAALSGGLEVEQGATLQVGEVFSMQSAGATAAATTAATVGGPVRITQATEGTATAISGTGEGQTRLNNTLIDIEQGASVTVENMLVSDTSRITGTPAAPAQTYATREGGNNIDVSQVKVVNTTIELSKNNAQVASGEGGSTTTSITLGQLQAVGTSDASGVLTLSGASNVMTVNSDAMSNLLVLSESSFVVDFSYLLNAIQLKDVDFIYLDFDSVNYQNLAGSTISATMDGHTIRAYFAGAGAAPNVPNVGVYFDVSAIPEPTSTTLSLLALAALAARRRRK